MSNPLTEAKFREIVSEAREALALADANRAHLPDALTHLRHARDLVRDVLPQVNEHVAEGYRLRP